jgi:hypothetical protein
VARVATARQRITCYGVGGEGMKAVGKVRWAKRSKAGLTQIAAHRWGGAVWWRSTVVKPPRWSPTMGL